MLYAISLMKKKRGKNPTYDADLHRRWPCPNAVGCITHVCTLHVVCERPFKDEDIVSNLSVARYWAIDPNKKKYIFDLKPHNKLNLHYNINNNSQ